MRASLLAVVAVLGLSPPAVAQIDQDLVEDFGRGILDALREGSFEALEPYVATADDFVEVVEAMPGLPAEQRAKALADKDAFATALRSHFRETLEQRGVMSDTSGLDYGRMRFAGMVAETRVPEEQPGVDPAVLADLRSRSADIAIRVTYEGEERRIALRDCFRVERGWVLMERATFGLSQ